MTVRHARHPHEPDILAFILLPAPSAEVVASGGHCQVRLHIHMWPPPQKLRLSLPIWLARVRGVAHGGAGPVLLDLEDLVRIAFAYVTQVLAVVVVCEQFEFSHTFYFH